MYTYYTSKLWNLSLIDNIDEEKTFESINDSFPTLDLYLKLNNKCLICESNGIVIIGSKTQKIKHALTNGTFAIINFHKRQFKCTCCNRTYYEKLDSLISSKQTSYYLEYAILNSLKDLNKTYKQVAKDFHVSSTFVQNVFDKHVSIDPKPLPSILSVDEIYARKLTKTKYCCVLMDPIEEIFIDILDSRRSDTLSPYLMNKPREEREKVQYFICDLNYNYRRIAHFAFKNAIVVADSFHVISNLSELFRRLRIDIMKEHDKVCDSSSEYWLLKKYYWMLNKSIDDIKKDHYEFRKWGMSLTKYQLLDYLLKVDPVLTEAYELKEAYRNFNRYNKLNPGDDKTEINKELESLIERFRHAKSDYMRQFGSLLMNWKNEIINSFIRINGWRLSNSIIENHNGQIKKLMANSYGFTNFKRARNRILYSINEIDGYSLTRTYKSNARKSKKRGKYKQK